MHEGSIREIWKKFESLFMTHTTFSVKENCKQGVERTGKAEMIQEGGSLGSR